MEHYAGSVEYDSADWLHKNKEPLNEQLHSLLKSSNNGLIRDELFVEESNADLKKQLLQNSDSKTLITIELIIG